MRSSNPTLHTQQAEAELVFHQLTHRANATVAEMIDIVDLRRYHLSAPPGFDGADDVFVGQHATSSLWLRFKACIHFHATHFGKVITL
jgi:hypothetical protein